MASLNIGEACFNVCVKGFDKEFGKAKSKAKTAGISTGKGFNSGFASSLKTLGRAFAGFQVFQGVKTFASDSLTLAGNLEQATVAFTTMLGSAEKANDLLGELSGFATKTPFDLVGIRQNAKQLLAMGISADDLLPTLKSLGDVSAGLSVPLERLALNYGQVIAQNKLTGKELRDFTTAGVPLLDQLSEQLGKTTADIQDMISDGEISAEIVTEAFRQMTSDGGKFANLMDKQSNTFQGAMSNYQDTMNSLKETLGTTFLPVLTTLIQKITPIIEAVGQRAAKNPELASTIAALTAGLIGIGSAMFVLGPIFSGIATIATASFSAIGAAVALAGGPITLAVAAIGGLFLAYKTNLFGIKDLVDQAVAFVRLKMEEFPLLFDIVAFALGGFVGYFVTNFSTIKDTVLNVVDGISGFFDRLVQKFQSVRSSIKTEIDAIKSTISSFSLGALGSGVLSVANNLIPGRYLGGPVSSGSPYIVGEKGPELFVPGRSGSIISNSNTQKIMNDNSNRSQQNITVNTQAQNGFEIANEISLGLRYAI